MPLPWVVTHLVWPLLSAGAGATGATLVRHAWEKKLGPSHGVPHPLLADTLDARLLAASLALLPTHKTLLVPPNPQLDAVLGGRRGDGLSWRYWSKGNGSPSGVVGSYLIGKAGWPMDLVNRAKDDDWVQGDGFVRGADVEKIREGAKKRGWLVTPVFAKGGEVAPSVAGVVGLVELGVVLGESFELEPGDYFAAGDRGSNGNGSSDGVKAVGVVLEVANGDGSRNVVTVEGRLTDGGEPCARWCTRVFRDDGSFSDERSAAKLLWVVRPT